MFDWFWEFLYSLLKAMLYCIDFIMDFASQLVGIKPITIDDKPRELLNYFLTSEPVLDAFKLVSIVAVILLFMFTAFAVIRAIGRLGEGKSPVGVFYDAVKALFYFLMIPVIMVVGGIFVSTIMTAVHKATSGSAASLGSSMFTLFADEACSADNKIQVLEDFRSGVHDYYSTSTVSAYFSLKKINYFLGYVVSFSVLIMLVKPLMSFVERVISLVILFIVAPLSVSSSVLDDGTRFKLWRDEVINKFLIAYGSLISINIFVLLVGIIYKVTFFENSFLNGLARMAFVLGGASACKMGAVMVGNLVNKGAGSQYAADTHHASSPLQAMAAFGRRAVGGLAHAATHNPLANNIRKDVDAAFSRGGDARRAVKAEAAQSRYRTDQLQKFNDKVSGGASDFSKRHDWRAALTGGGGGSDNGRRDGSLSSPGVRGGGSSGGGSPVSGGKNTDNAANKQGADTIRGALQSGKSHSNAGDEKR